MAGAWKSSEGGAIKSLGGSLSDGSYTTNTLLVDAASNVRGVIVRTLTMVTIGGGAYAFVKAGSSRFMAVYVGFAVMPDEIFIPAGKGISVEVISGTHLVSMTYDIL